MALHVIDGDGEQGARRHRERRLVDGEQR